MPNVVAANRAQSVSGYQRDPPERCHRPRVASTSLEGESTPRAKPTRVSIGGIGVEKPQRGLNVDIGRDMPGGGEAHLLASEGDLEELQRVPEISMGAGSSIENTWGTSKRKLTLNA